MSRTSGVAPTAIVTGASSGIGRALALRLGREGYRVGLIARRRDALEAVAVEVAEAGGVAAAETADVGDRPALRAAVEAIERQLGPATVMVANAGVGTPTRVDPLNTSEIEATLRTNLLGVVYAIDAVLPGMLARGEGHLVAISSLAAFKGLPGDAAYSASKAGVNAFMEGLRIDVRRRGLTVTAVCPGFVRTPMAPPQSLSTPFMMSADEAARRIARVIVGRRGGLVCFPRRMALLMPLIARLPDAVLARLSG